MTREEQHEVLVKARNTIAKGWCQHSLWQPKLGEVSGALEYNVCARGGIFAGLGLNSFKDFGSMVERKEWRSIYQQTCEIDKLLVSCLDERIRRQLGRIATSHNPEGETIVAWNNAPERTQQEVLDLFDKAIAKTAPDPNPDLAISHENAEDLPLTPTEKVVVSV